MDISFDGRTVYIGSDHIELKNAPGQDFYLDEDLIKDAYLICDNIHLIMYSSRIYKINFRDIDIKVERVFPQTHSFYNAE